jgi:hypothetical protein
LLQRLDKTISIFESYFLKIITISVLITLITISKFFSDEIPLKNFLAYFLENKESTFINISAIFIGMYFALFTIFGSVKRDSIISTLPDKDLTKLIRFLRNALIGSFIYLFLTLFFVKNYESTWQYFNIVLFTSLIYMLLSALRFGVYIYFIVKDDIDRVADDHKELAEKEDRQQEIMVKLENFLNDYDNLAQQDKNEELRKIIRERENS